MPSVGRCMHGAVKMDLLIPALLAILKKQPNHGYSLMEKLSELGLNISCCHPSILYRALRTMELQGLVISNWEVQVTGPARRVYSITQTGEDFLNNWCFHAKENVKMIHKIINISEGGE